MKVYEVMAASVAKYCSYTDTDTWWTTSKTQGGEVIKKFKQVYKF